MLTNLELLGREELSLPVKAVNSKPLTLAKKALEAMLPRATFLAP